MKHKKNIINKSNVITRILVVLIIIGTMLALIQQRPKENRDLGQEKALKSQSPSERTRASGLQKLLYGFSLYDSDILTSVRISVKIEGKISDILERGGIKDTVKYSKGFVLKSISGRENNILFRESEMDKVEVYRGDEKIDRIALSDIDIGDNVIIYEEFDLNNEKSYNLSRIEIVKL